MPVSGETSGTLGVSRLPPLGQIASTLPFTTSALTLAASAQARICCHRLPGKYDDGSIAFTPLFSKPRFICRANPDMIVATSVASGKLDDDAGATESARPELHSK